MFDTLTGRLKYQYIKRDSTLNFSNDPGGGTNDPNFLLPFTSAFDMQNLTTNQVRLYLDWTPMPLLSASFEGNWAKIDYDNVTLGRTDNDVDGVFLSVDWGDPNKFLVRASATGSRRSTRRTTATSVRSPAVRRRPPTRLRDSVRSRPRRTRTRLLRPELAAVFRQHITVVQLELADQGQDLDDRRRRRLAGDGAWLLNASFIYVHNEGEATFASQNNIGNPIPINNFDNSKQTYFNLKGTYTLNKNWSFTGGYSYEKYTHDDVGATDSPT